MSGEEVSKGGHEIGPEKMLREEVLATSSDSGPQKKVLRGQEKKVQVKNCSEDVDRRGPEIKVVFKGVTRKVFHGSQESFP